MTTATKAIVSSLMPKTAPKTPNRSMTSVMTIFPVPSFRTNEKRSRFLRLSMNFMIPSSTAFVLLTIQNAPPMTRTKAIIPACWLKPSYNAENTCHVWGCPSLTNQVETALKSITAKIIT